MMYYFYFLHVMYGDIPGFSVFSLTCTFIFFTLMVLPKSLIDILQHVVRKKARYMLIHVFDFHV